MKFYIALIMMMGFLTPIPSFAQRISSDEIDQHIQNAYAFRKEKKIITSLNEFEIAIDALLAKAEALPDGDERKKSVSDSIGAYIEDYAKLSLPQFRILKTHEIATAARKLSKDHRLYSSLLFAATSIIAHEALGKGEYDNAMRLFEEIKINSLSSENGAREMENLHGNFYYNIALKSKEMERFPKSPDYVMKILSVRYPDVVFRWKEGTVESTLPLLKLKKGDLDLVQIAEESLRKTIFVMSEGKLALSYERIEVPPVTILRPAGKTSVFEKSGTEIVEELSGEMGELIRNKLVENDVIFIAFGGVDAYAFHGGKFTFKTQDKSFRRGMINIGMSNFRYFEGSGFIPNAIGTIPRLYMHEFFHVVEARVGIKPSHGFKGPNRKKYLAWIGNDELEYYYWHFRETIPGLLRVPKRKGDWTEFSFR